MKDMTADTPPEPPVLLRRSFKSGLWEVELASPVPPALEVRTDLGDMFAPEVMGGEGDVWRVRLAIPTGMIGEGMQTFLLVDTATSDVVDRLPILVGGMVEEDLRAELDLMRAELDLLKKAFRRFAANGM